MGRVGYIIVAFNVGAGAGALGKREMWYLLHSFGIDLLIRSHFSLHSALTCDAAALPQDLHDCILSSVYYITSTQLLSQLK